MSATRPSDADGIQVDGAWPQRAVEAIELLRRRTEQLQHALESRIAIEQAKGVLSERLVTTTDDAFSILRRAARSAQMPLHDLARQVVHEPATPDPVRRELERRQRDVDGAAR